MSVIQTLGVCVNNPLLHETTLCPICWEAVFTHVPLPCKHLFHTVCIVSWFEKQRTCPMCRVVFSFVPVPKPLPRETAPLSVPSPPSPTSQNVQNVITITLPQRPPTVSVIATIQTHCCFGRMWR